MDKSLQCDQGKVKLNNITHLSVAGIENDPFNEYLFKISFDIQTLDCSIFGI